MLDSEVLPALSAEIKPHSRGGRAGSSFPAPGRDRRTQNQCQRVLAGLSALHQPVSQPLAGTCEEQGSCPAQRRALGQQRDVQLPIPFPTSTVFLQ